MEGRLNVATLEEPRVIRIRRMSVGGDEITEKYVSMLSVGVGHLSVMRSGEVGTSAESWSTPQSVTYRC
jgi:hypothetical protein